MTEPISRRPPRGNEDLDRLRSFSDSVFAVAITLVAVSFVVPATEPTDTRIIDFLAREWPRYLSFVAGFLVIGAYWLSHHRTFQLVVRADWRVQWLNLSLLFFVVLTPLTTEVLASYRTLPAAYLAFSANAALMGLFNWAVWRHAVAAGLMPATLSARALQIYQWRAGLLAIVFALATIAALVSVPLVVVTWCALVPGWVSLRFALGRVPAVEAAAEAKEQDEPGEAEAIEHAAALRTTPEGPFGSTPRERANLSRLLSFSDNVYAFAITLLVVHLKLPSSRAGQITTNEQLVDYLASLGSPGLVAYAIGFLVIGLFWNLHCRDFSIVERPDGTLLALNLVHLMTVAVLPFATDLLSSFEALGVPLVLYSVTNAVVGLTLAGCFWYATLGHRLVDAAWPERDLRRWRLLGLVAPAGFLLGAAVGVVAPWAIWFFWIVPSLSLRLLHRRLYPTTPAAVVA
ncbi:MAG: TMEM175 family protein [Acidimicrobiales bacterium]